MDKIAAGPSRCPQMRSQIQFSSAVTQKSRKNRLSLTQPQKPCHINKNEVRQTDIVPSLLSPPKILTQAAVIEVKKVDDSYSNSVSSVGIGSEVKEVRKCLKVDIPQYCPTCQMPFKNVKVLPSIHAAQCDVNLDELRECSAGVNCSSTSVFHYRDFAHSGLARIRATEKSPVIVQSSSEVVYSSVPNRQRSNRKLSFDDSDCSSSATKSLSWLLSNRNSQMPSGLHDTPARISTCLDFEENLVPGEHLNGDCSFVNMEKTSFQNNICGRKTELWTGHSSDNLLGCVKSSKIGSVETCRVSCSDACFKDVECNSDDGVEKSVRASVSVVLSPNKNSKGLESPVKIHVSCNKEGWEEVGFDSCSGAAINSVKVRVCECSKNMEVNCVVGDSSVSVNSSNFKVSAIGKDSNRCNTAVDPSSSDKDCGPSVGANSLSSKGIIESSSCASTPSTVEQLESAIAGPKESTVTHNKNLLAKNQWQQLMPRLREKELRLAPSIGRGRDVESSSSVSTTSMYKSCPHYKRIPDTSFAVDAFKNGPLPGITTYFLTHFHSDHYGGLRKNFNRPIYCSSITAALVRLRIRVDEKYIRKIDVDETLCISGVLVTALDANHCPGSLMFLFQLKDGRNFLHVGDFRADPKMESYPCFWNITIDRLYLDTTYCHPKHTFPPQCEMVAKVVDIVSNHISRLPRTLVVCGTYTIGKEKVFIAVAEWLNCKLWARPDKRKVMDCLQDPEISNRLTNNRTDAQVHICPMSDINFESLSSYLKQFSELYTNILAFKPTGWELKAKSEVSCVTRGNITICGVPYSEHSSFSELKRFVQFLKPKEVFPTVNLSSLSTMQKYFKEWLSEHPLKRRSEESAGGQVKLTKYIVKQKSFL